MSPLKTTSSKNHAASLPLLALALLLHFPIPPSFALAFSIPLALHIK
jgi:hypothetical protein